MIPLPSFLVHNHSIAGVAMVLCSPTCGKRRISWSRFFFRAVPHHVLNVFGHGEFTASTLMTLTVQLGVNKKDALSMTVRRGGQAIQTFPISGTFHWGFAMPPLFVLLAPAWLEVWR